ncbi:cell division protein FtsQ/DivIB [Oceanobacillus chungangensis]|uniref:Cell division protein DivIB n=1 Tax=Oceanobacillus chungangensis TaxID=1229152 RepID=A0A3D8PP88_9BACI|nr:cell division protein FtsQ/DivIB [Oceanobacillus chungangensis]RDW17923.1 cell division protein FtsQ [Oceanobacillus chungangensis]
MSKKNIVSIEDRIPKLKQARKKKANRRLIFYLSIFFFLISIIVYLQSPLSNIKTIQVHGNTHVSNESIIEQSGLTMDTNIWMLNQKHTEDLLTKNPIIESVEVSRKLPWTVDIKVNEYKIVGYTKEETNYFPILGNGVMINQLGQSSFNGKSPLILGFTEEEYLHKMAEELNELPSTISALISEIHWQPTDENKNKILLYMNDGYLVDATIRDFSDKMEVYPSIVAQLDPKSKGIIHLGVGVYFESFEKRPASDEEEIDRIEEDNTTE